MSTTDWKQTTTEERLRAAIGPDVPWAAVERLATQVRLSGNEEERAAIDYIIGQLESFGVSYELHTPTLFVSWPLGATLRTVGDDPLSVQVKTPSMSVSTDGD